MQYLPTDVSSFTVMRTGNYIYVDKTEFIYNLIKPGESRYYFLSRPRRFGKSLLISTLRELFLGNKKLFEGLWIAKSPYEWQQYPVIHLDFSTIDYKTSQELDFSLRLALDQVGLSYGIDVRDIPLLKAKFKTLIEKLSHKNKIVILIDEYDKPILDHLKDISQAQEIRETLKVFYDAIKGMDDFLRAIFVTGVTKFSKTSIFSGINTLNDISIKPEAAEILGYTEDEIKTYFAEHLRKSNPQAHLPAILATIKRWYNGYRFSDKEIKVYNPFSVLYYLKDNKLINYWWESGTPSFLIHLIKTEYQTLENLDTKELTPDSLGYFQINKIPLVPLLFQTGYLTIADYNKETTKFTLSFPNFEVENSFNKYLISILADSSTIAVEDARSQMIAALNNKDLNSFCIILQALFAQIPYTLHIKKESYYHSLFHFLVSFIALEAQSEVMTDRGRIDLVIYVQNYIYIFELKINAIPSVALAQIHEKKYYQKYFTHKKT